MAYSFSFATFIILRYSLLYSKQYFEYPHPSVISDSKGFTVKGNVKAIYQPSSSSSNQSSSNRTTTDTMDKYISQLQIRCFNIDSMHQFASLRGRQKRTCSQKILLVWTSQSMICLSFG